MRYYKIIRGYEPENYIEIDETELLKAYYCFLEKVDSVFSGGAIRGGQILMIQPDYTRAMGWNRGHRLGPDDYAELKQKGVDRNHMDLLVEAKEKVNYALKSGGIENLLNPASSQKQLA